MHIAETTRTSPTSDRERLHAVIAPVVSAHGAELCDFELKNEDGWVLRVFVERLGSSAKKLSTKDAAVDLDLCSSIARDLSPALDSQDPIPHAYDLEVGSPGVERALRSQEDFDRFVGEKAKLKLRAGVNGQKVVVGTLASVDGNGIVLRDGPMSHVIPLDDVVSAQLVFEFGPSPKRVSSPKKKRRP